ncbi:hypothetical protein DV738_g2474, partial [Chaetothyriales sp. CBS 135597]
MHAQQVHTLVLFVSLLISIFLAVAAVKYAAWSHVMVDGMGTWLGLIFYLSSMPVFSLMYASLHLLLLHFDIIPSSASTAEAKTSISVLTAQFILSILQLVGWLVQALLCTFCELGPVLAGHQGRVPRWCPQSQFRNRGKASLPDMLATLVQAKDFTQWAMVPLSGVLVECARRQWVRGRARDATRARAIGYGYGYDNGPKTGGNEVYVMTNLRLGTAAPLAAAAVRQSRSMSASPDSTAPHGVKRKADDGNPPTPPTGQQHTRSKRNRYISIACNECKRRKIKCNGQTPCHRCGNLNLDCIYAPNTLKDSAEFQQLKQTITTLQDQVQDLYAQLSELRTTAPHPVFADVDLGFSPGGTLRRRRSQSGSATRILPPLVSPKPRPPQRVLPAFVGPTSSAYGFNVAKSTLQTMGITNSGLEDGAVSRERSQAASPVLVHPQKDPLWEVELKEVLRLLDVFEEEIGITYPVYGMDKLAKHATLLYKFIDASRRQGLVQPLLPGDDTLDDDDTTVLKMVLACTLALEGNGRSVLGSRFFESAKPAIDLKVVTTTSLMLVIQLVLTATYYFQTDEETQAWRFIGIAARICIEMGLHRRDSLLKTFTNEAEYQQALRIFWSVYALDRRWSFGTGMPFALQDADIDPALPEPDDTYPYLKHITKYNQIATKVWFHNVAYESGQTPTKKDEIGFLDYQIVSWYQDLPADLQFNSRELQRENEIPGRGRRRLRMLMHLRKNQARISIYRPILHSATSIMENRHHAQQVVDVAKETITTLTGISQISDIYLTQQVMYHYFLVQALAVLFLAVAHAPAVFCNQTRQEFYAAMELIKGFSTKSHVSRRLWRMTRGLKEMADKIGMLARNGNGDDRLELSSHSPLSRYTTQLTLSSATYSDMSQSSSQSPDSWIAQFCSLVGHEYFAEVSEDFIEDDFNLTGLQSQVSMYKEALEMILDVEPSETGSSLLDAAAAHNGGRRQSGRQSSSSRRHTRTNSDTSMIESSAELLYGLIHARYITSRPGIQQMMEKYELAHFGYCPRVYCTGARVLPVGLTDTPGQQTVKLYCPSCLDVYTPPNSRFQAVDGAFFGTTFGCLFFMTFPDLDISPPKRRSIRDQTIAAAATAPEDTEAVMSHTEQSASHVTPSRSSSLTLPNAPPIPSLTSARSENSAAIAAAASTLPPQPASINGVHTSNLAPGLGKGKIYEPKIYGFRVSDRAKCGPRMKWLRSKPLDINELDEARLWHERYGGDVDGDGDMDADDQDDSDEEAIGEEGAEDEEADEEDEGGHGGAEREPPERDGDVKMAVFGNEESFLRTYMNVLAICPHEFAGD